MSRRICSTMLASQVRTALSTSCSASAQSMRSLHSTAIQSNRLASASMQQQRQPKQSQRQYTQLTRTSLRQSESALRSALHQPARSIILDTPPPEPLERIPVTFIDQEGRQFKVDAVVGETLLQAVRTHEIPMPNNCEGGGTGAEEWDTQACCTLCHVYIDNQAIVKLPPRHYLEERMSHDIPNLTKNSRFACEIIVTKDLANMTIVLPDYGRLGEQFSRATPW